MDETGRRGRFELVYRAYCYRIVGYVVRRTEAPEDAADVVAEVFLTAWRRVDDLPPGHEALLWLYGVARRILANHRRAERRQSQLVERMRREISTRVPYTNERTSGKEMGLVIESLGRLREEDREILGLVAWEGLSPDQLGKVLGCSANAAKIRLHRARRRLARRLAEAGLATRFDKGRKRKTGREVAASATLEEES